MTEANQNIDLKQSELNQINSTELQNLIQDFENKKNFEKIANNFDLNKNSINMSETENKILNKLYELGNIYKQINFLKNLSNLIKNKTEEKNIYSGNKNNETLLNKLLGNNIDKIKEIESITKKYNYEDLIKNKEDRRKILEINYKSHNCPEINFKNNSISLNILKKEIAETENQEIYNLIIKKLGKTFAEEFKNLLKGECKSEKLINKLISTKKFTTNEIQEIIKGNALNKETISTIKLKEKLKDKYQEYIISKNKEKFLKNNGFSKNEIENILKETKNIENTKKAQNIKIEDINKLREKTQKTFINYNDLNIEVFINDLKLIKNITDFNKLKNILNNKKFKAKYNNILNLKKLDQKLLYLTDLNSNLQNLKTLELLKKEGYTKKDTLGIQDIKNIKLEDLTENGKIRFDILELFNKEALTMLIYQNNKNTNDIEKNIQKIQKNYPKLTNNLKEIIKNINNTNGNFNINKLNKLKSGKLKIYNINNNEKLILDNYLLQTNISEILSIFKGENISYLENYPKTLNKILNNPNYIINCINQNPNFYLKFLSDEQQKNNQYISLYINSVINLKTTDESNKTTIAKNREEYISKIKIVDIEQSINIFEQINSKTDLDINKILSYPEMQNTLQKIMNNTNVKQQLNNLNSKDNKIAQKIIKSIENYSDNINKRNEQYQKIFDQSEFKKTLEKKSNLINKLYENPEFTKYLEQQNSNIQGPIVGICRGVLGDLSEGEKKKNLIDNNISLIAQEFDKQQLNPKEFGKKLKDINKFIKKAFLEQQKQEENNKLSKRNIDILEKTNKNFTKLKEKKDGKFINYSGIEKEFNNFSKIEKEQNNKITHEEIINLFIEKYNLTNLDDTLKQQIKQHLIQKKAIINFDKKVKKINNNLNYYFNIYKNNNGEKINKLNKTIEKNSENNIIKTQNYTYFPETGTIITKGKTLKIPKAYKEKLKNPENRKKIINFDRSLKTVGLGNLLQYTDKISIAIGTVNGVNDNDLFDEIEQQKIINNILISVGKKPLPIYNNIKQYLNDYTNKFAINGQFKNKLNKGDSNIEEQFFDKYINNKPTFNLILFKQNTKKIAI